MRIAIWHNLPSGGGKRALYYHVRGLVERGHTVEAWRPPTADHSYLPLDDLIPEHVVPLSWRPSTRRSMAQRLRGPAHDAQQMHAAFHAQARACAAQIEDAGFDILLAGSCRFTYAPPIGRYVTMPSALYLQEPNRVLYEALPELRWIAPPDGQRATLGPRQLVRTLKSDRALRGLRLMARQEIENARAFDRILVNSYFSRESVLRAYGLDARVCYLGVDTDLFTVQSKAREDVVIGLGSITPVKNVAFVVQALGCIPAPRPQLLWIGNVAEPEYADAVIKLAAALEVPFELRVRVSDDELVDLLNRARLMAYAPRLEPFGFAPLEANACGLPVVAVAEGGLRETVVEGVNGLLVESRPQYMAAGIERLRRDPAYAARLGDAGRNIVAERWSLSASIDRLERHLSNVLAARTGSEALAATPRPASV